MIATISFSAMAEWVIGAYIAGCMTGTAFWFWRSVRAPKKK